MIGDPLKVQRPIELQFKTGRMLDGLSFSKLVSSIRIGTRPEDERIIGVGSMHMQIPKIGLALSRRGGVSFS